VTYQVHGLADDVDQGGDDHLFVLNER
jgi:hypothetical protein